MKKPYDREDLLVMWSSAIALAAFLLLVLFNCI
jgi:hypothetical protein